MPTATFVKQMPRISEEHPDGFRGDARLYKVDPPVEYNKWDDDYVEFTPTPADHVIASAVHILGTPETYLFPADKDGEVLSWAELKGSRKGTLSHALVLEGAGYTIVGG